MPAIHFLYKILYVIEIGVNLHCAVFVLKEKEEGTLLQITGRLQSDYS